MTVNLLNTISTSELTGIVTSPGFSMLLGGSLTLIGSLATEWWRINHERKNLSQSLKVEIEECTSSLESFKAAAEYKQTNKVSWNSYDNDLSQWKELSGVQLECFLVSQGVKKLDTDFDDIYSSNCDDIGRLDQEVSESVIRFYSEYRELKAEAEENIDEIINTYVRVSEEQGQNPSKEMMNNNRWESLEAQMRMSTIISLGERTYELQQECLNLLEE